MFSSKKIAILALGLAVTSLSYGDTVACADKKYFSDNECQVCQDGGEVETTATSITLTKQELSWENELDGINQNFYETSQNPAELKTNIATPPTTWDEKGLTWGSDVVWKDLDGLNMFSLDAGKKITIKTIADKTSVALTNAKQVTDPYFVVKVPISYYELKMGTFKESEKKTVNYCISYTPKKPTTTTPPATTTPTTTTPKTTTPTTTTTPKTVTPPVTETPELNSAPEELEVKDKETPEKPVEETSEDDDIPSYNAKPVKTLNSAGSDPTRVEAGPAENMLIVIATLLLAVLLFPKVNRIFEGK